ncbi:MAG: LysM peptidoglycan-binding domain-containing protein, partial [Desulfomonilia bacterium]|nr:LysM peptidoglycan-binding domain-containing protein [Desulfomonilia bacterium]
RDEEISEDLLEEPDTLYDIIFDITPRADHWIQRFSGADRKYFQDSLNRFETLRPIMEDILDQHGLPRDLVYLCFVESGGHAHAVSRAGATGYWQFMPGTARIYGLSMNRWVDERRDLEKSTAAAARYLKHLHRIFDDWLLAIAAYNAGEGTIFRIMRNHEHVRAFWDISQEMPIKGETLEYVPKFIATLTMAKNREAYGLTDPPDEKEILQYDSVTVNSFFYLDEIAEILDVPRSTMLHLNPELIRECTPPLKKQYTLKVPKNSGEALTAHLAEASRSSVTYTTHTIERGDTLSGLAKKHATSTRMIAQTNRMAVNDILRPGRILIIPTKTSPAPVSSRHTHTVAAGETLKSISKKHGIEVQDLIEMNRISDPDTIFPDMVLFLPPKAAPRGSPTVKTTQYRVKKGDTLWGISKQFEVTTQDIMRWNRLRPTAQIFPGDQLTIYH